MIKLDEYNRLIKRTGSCKVTAADFLEAPHHGNNTQFLIDHLYSDIKIQKKNLKKTSSFTSFFTSLFDSFIKNEFDIKLTKYKTELEDLGENDAITDTYFYTGVISDHDVHIEKFKDYRKRLALLEIISVLNELVEGHSEIGLKRLKELEISLEKIKGEEPGVFILPADEFYPIITELREAINDKIKVLRKKLILLLRFKYRLIGRDIRQSYRNIIRIIFKNMDDQSGDDDNLFVLNINQQRIINQKNWSHGQETNYRTTGYYHKYEYQGYRDAKRCAERCSNKIKPLDQYRRVY